MTLKSHDSSFLSDGLRVPFVGRKQLAENWLYGIRLFPGQILVRQKAFFQSLKIGRRFYGFLSVVAFVFNLILVVILPEMKSQ